MRATVVLRNAPTERILAAVHDGLKSEILFDLRLYRRQKGLLAWLGDRLVFNLQVSRVAYFDLFTGRYVIEHDGFVVGSFGDPQEFLRRYVVLEDYPFAAVESGERGEYYVLARVRVSPVRILGPLNIVTLFSSEGPTTTDWVERPLEGS